MKRVLWRLAIVSCLIIFGVIFCAGCSCGEQKNGSFHDVKTAYERDWITKDDVVRIAELHNKKTFSVLGDDVAVMLKRSYAKQYPRDNFDFNDVEIKEYLGEFSGCFAVIIAYDDEDVPEVLGKDTVADTDIFYSNGFRLCIYKNM